LLKVKLQVKMRDLGLTSIQEERLKHLAGLRFCAKKNQLTLVAERFPNRLENKR
jgi:hypothetical protein